MIWGRIFNSWLRRGADHGHAAYMADEATPSREDELKRALSNICRRAGPLLEGALNADKSSDPAMFDLLHRAVEAINAGRAMLEEKNDKAATCEICGGEGWYEVDQWVQRDGGAVMMPAIVTCECRSSAAEPLRQGQP